MLISIWGLFCVKMEANGHDIIFSEYLLQAKKTLVQHSAFPDLETAYSFYQQAQKDSAAHYLVKAQAQLDAQEDEALYIPLNRLIGQIYVADLQDYKAAKPYLEEALLLLSDDKETPAYISALDWLIYCHYWVYESEKTIEYATEGLELSKVQNDVFYEVLFNQWIGKAFVVQNNYEKALEYYKNMMNLAEQLENADVIYGANLNLACTYYKMKLPEEALPYLERCENYIEEWPEDRKKRANFLIWQGTILGAVEQYKEAESILKKATILYDSLKIHNEQMHVRLELARLYLHQNKQKLCIQKAKEALELAPEKLTLFEKQFIYDLLYWSYKDLGRYQAALQSHEQLIRTKKTLDSINNVRTIQELEQRYRTSEQQQVIEEQEASRRSLLFALGVSILFLIGTFFSLYFLNRNRKRLIQQKKVIESQAEQLYELDRLKSNFFANVSHELRTPLTLMLGPLNSLLKNNSLGKRDFKLLNSAQQGAQNLMKMVGSILDLSKLEANKMEVKWETTPLFFFARRVVAAFESQAQIKNIAYHFEYKAEQYLHIELDQSKMTVILNNLLSNALKFTSSGGSIRVIVEDLDNIIQFKVVDTGRGIHSKDLPYIFDRFYQSKEKSALVEGGTGIGLALCKEFAELMEGKVLIESELGKGSIFTVQIVRKEVFGKAPKVTEIEAAEEQKEEITPVIPRHLAEVKSKEKTILVVEDNSSLRKYMETILTDDYNVLLAANGKKALSLLAEKTNEQLPNLILSDIMMPEMDGYQLLEILKQSDQYRHIPVVMLTARADVQDRLKALRIGVDDYLLKPFLEEELFARIDNLLRHQLVRQKNIAASDRKKPKKEKIIISQEDQTWLSEFEVFVQDNISNSLLSVPMLAEEFAMSESTLLRQLKRLTGLTPIQYLKESKLERARQFIETKTYNSISQVAYQIGYADAKSFSRAFKTRYGKSPSIMLSSV